MTNLTLALMISLLPVSVFAQVRAVAPSAGALAWSGPIAAFVGEVGQVGIRQLDSVSMPRLAAFDEKGRLPLIKSPELLNPLAQTLAESFVDPAEFASMPLEFKTTILRTAAGLTESRLNQKVWSVVLDTQKGIGRSRFADVSRETRQARDTSIYLNDRTMEGLVLLERRVADFTRARDEAMEAFLHDLPKKIAAGNFDGRTLLQTEDDAGRTLWKTAGSSPEAVYPTPEAALEARIAALETMPAGPWSVKEAELLLTARMAGMESGALSPSRWTNSARERLDAIKDRGELAAADGKLVKAVERFAADKARTTDVRAVARFYGDAAAAARDIDWTMRARVLATIYEGWRGLPGWRLLSDVDAKVAEQKAANNRTISYAWIGAAATAAVAAAVARSELFLPMVLALSLISIALAAVSLFSMIFGPRPNASREDLDLREGMLNYFES